MVYTPLNFACFAAAIIATTVVSPSARAGDCTQWRAGPLHPTGVVNGIADSLTHACTWDPDGGGPQPALLAVAGDFNPDSAVTNGVAVYNSLTNTWQQIGTMTDGGAVNAMTAYNNELIVGGDFLRINNLAHWCFARYNGNTWQGDGPHRPVYSLAQNGNDLLIGSDIQVSWGGSSGPIFRWTSPTDWDDLPLCMPLDEDDYVLRMGMLNGELITHVVRWPNSGLPFSVTRLWFACQQLNDPMYSATVMQGFNGNLIIAGASASPYNNIARFDGSAYHAMGDGLSGPLNAHVNCLAVHNGELYAGGLFSQGGAISISNIARWTGSSWQPLGSGINGEVHGLASYNGALYAVGSFSVAGGQACTNIARWSNGIWSAVQTGVSFSSVMAMTNFGSQVIAAGQFQQMTTGGAQALNIMSWDGLASSPLGQGMNDRVLALKSFTYPGPTGANELVAAGRFTIAGGLAANRIARWVVDAFGSTLPQWAPMGAGLNWEVNAIERFNGQTYAAGFFTATGTTPIGFIARWNETTDVWEPLGVGLNDGAFALKAYNGFLYVGGLFTTAGGLPTGGLARWNGSSWSQVGGNFVGIVTSLEVHNNELVIGGIYPGINNSPNLAKYNGSTYSTFGTGGTSAAVWSLCSLNGNLYVGGEFNTIGGVAAKKIGVWNGSAWSEVEGGTDSTATKVFALTGFHDEVHAGGTFLTVSNGSLSSPGWARFQSTGEPWIHTQPLPSQTIACEEDFQASVQVAAGYDGVTFQWRRNAVAIADGPTAHGSLVSGASTAALSIVNVVSPDAGTYDCVITNPCGSVASGAATLTVSTCCVADIAPTGAPDGTVNVDDLLLVINAWGNCPAPCPPACAADINNDCAVDVDDLLMVINAWGPCP